MQEAKYTLTSYCLESGTLRLTPSLRQVFGEDREATVVAPDGTPYPVEIDPERGELRGLGAWLRAQDLAPNDRLRFVREGDRVSLDWLGRRLKPRKAPAPSDPAPKPSPAPRRVTPYPKEVIYPSTGGRPGFVEALAALGLEAFPEGKYWLLRSRMGRRGYALVLAPKGALSAEALLEAKAKHAARYAAWLVPEAEPEAKGAIAAVAEPALLALKELHQSFPLGAQELERFLARGRLGMREVEELRREVAGVLGERAQFSTVLSAIAGFRKDQVFLLEDLLAELGEGISGDVAVRMLEVLAGPPFFAVARLAPGEYRLREEVPEVLDTLAAYAAQLKRRLQVPG